MKRILSIFFTTLHLFILGQNQLVKEATYNELFFNNRTEKFEITSIIILNELNKDTIFNRALNWFSEEFKKYHDEKFQTVLVYKNCNDTSEYKIIGRHQHFYPLSKKSNKKLLQISHHIEIYIRDNRCKIVLTDFILPDFLFIPIEDAVMKKNKNFSHS